MNGGIGVPNHIEQLNESGDFANGLLVGGDKNPSQQDVSVVVSFTPAGSVSERS